jgi:hypothetical protein
MLNKMKSTAIALGLLFVANSSFAEYKVFGQLDGKILVSADSSVKIIGSDGKVQKNFDKMGHLHDVWKLDNGNILSAGKFVAETDPKTGKRVRTIGPKQEIEDILSCQRLENGNTLVASNKDGKIYEITPDDKIAFEMLIPDKGNGHFVLRMVRKLDNGNYLVCQPCKKRVIEITPEAKIVWNVKVPSIAFSAVRLKNGNTLVGHVDAITEYNKAGEIVWELTPSELAPVKIGKFTGINVLDNGNIVTGIYSLQKGKDGAAVVEVTRDKKIVWRLAILDGGPYAMMSCQKISNKCKAYSNKR